MNRTLKTCLMVIAWAAIGTRVALQFSATWWAVCLGLVCGSLGGYLTYEWRTVVWAIPIAWRRATSWRPDWTWWGYAIVDAAFITAWIGSVALVWTLYFYGMELLGEGSDPLGPIGKLWSTIGTTIIWCAINFGIMVDANQGVTREATRGLLWRYNSMVQLPVMLAKVYWQWLRPVLTKVIGAIKSLPKALASAALATLVLLLGAVYFAARFTWHLYKLIYTEERRMVAVSIAGGVLVGVQFGSPMVGGISGGAFWLANRLLIAAHFLKTLPVRVR